MSEPHPAENDAPVTYRFGEDRDGLVDMEITSNQGVHYYRVPRHPIDLDGNNRPIPPAATEETP